MSAFLFELLSTEKSYTAPSKEISLCSSFAKIFDSFPKPELYRIMLSFALNLKISVSFTYK